MITSSPTIPANMMVRGEFVIVPRKEYERLVKGRAPTLPTFIGYEAHTWKGKKYQIPVYQLHGKAAERLDQRVREGLKEYREGKTVRASSVTEALKKYVRKKNRENRV